MSFWSRNCNIMRSARYWNEKWFLGEDFTMLLKITGAKISKQRRMALSHTWAQLFTTLDKCFSEGWVENMGARPVLLQRNGIYCRCHQISSMPRYGSEHVHPQFLKRFIESFFSFASFVFAGNRVINFFFINNDSKSTLNNFSLKIFVSNWANRTRDIITILSRPSLICVLSNLNVMKSKQQRQYWLW